MSWGGNKTVSFAHSQLAQLAWAINSVDRSRPLREIEEHLCQIARQIDNISTRRDRELRAKRKALIKKIEKLVGEIDESSSSSSESSRSSSSSSSSSSDGDDRRRRRAQKKRDAKKRSSRGRKKKRKRGDDDGGDEKKRAKGGGDGAGDDRREARDDTKPEKRERR